ncbi:MAG: hypothetical protein RLO51_11060 [Thalassobaculum sp.]|uniref:hypothetical protein n=1 Tax=Thalassobaculum sp. TaxID=2022740 RepID=UPI0032EB039E
MADDLPKIPTPSSREALRDMGREISKTTRPWGRAVAQAGKEWGKTASDAVGETLRQKYW